VFTKLILNQGDIECKNIPNREKNLTIIIIGGFKKTIIIIA